MSFTCEKCDKTFSEEKYLKQHQKKRIPCDRQHICQKCGSEFTTAFNLRKHRNKKTPCIPTEVPVLNPTNPENKCKFCGKTYATSYNLSRHIKSCPMRNNQEAMFQMMATIMEQNKKTNEQNQELLSIIKQNGLGNQINNNNITVNNVQQNMYVNVTICSFGSEDLTKLDHQGVINLLKGQVADFIPRMVEYIHANPDYPEFHNVFFDPIRKKVIVFKQNHNQQLTWQFDDIDHVSKQITDKIKDHIHPLNSPYYNSLSKEKDSETANKIPQIMCTNWTTPEVLEGTKESLSKVITNEGFMDQVHVQELE